MKETMLNIRPEIILQVQALGRDSLFAMQRSDMQETKILKFLGRSEAILDLI